MLEIIKVATSLPYWSWLGILAGTIIAGSSFIIGYKSTTLNNQTNPSNLVMDSSKISLIRITPNQNSVELMLKNIGSDVALVHEIDFLAKTIFVSKGTCSYMPPHEYNLYLDFLGSKHIVNVAKNIKILVSQRIESGDVDRIKLSFIVKKDECMYIDLEGSMVIQYDTGKKLEIENVNISL